MSYFYLNSPNSINSKSFKDYINIYNTNDNKINLVYN